MTREELLLQEYEKKLSYLYAKANTKSKKKKIVYDLFNFSSICYEHFDIEKVFDWEQDDELYDLLQDLSKPFIENTFMNKEVFLDISNSVLNTFINLKYPFYDDYCKILYSVSPYKSQEIIFEFLNSYDPRLLKFYKDKLEKCEIFDVSLYAKTGYSGLHYSMDALKTSLIFCEDGVNSIFSAAMNIHELGHAYENNIMYSAGINGIGISKDVTPFVEVSSRFFEYAFYNFLKENRIYTDDTKICLLKYYKTMLCHIYEMNLICKSDFLNINRYGFYVIDDYNVFIHGNNLKEQLNYYNLSSELGEEINYKHAFVYGLGALLAIHLYDNYKQDPKCFKKEFKNALINYPCIGIEAFNKVGVNIEELNKGNTLKRVLTDI